MLGSIHMTFAAASRCSTFLIAAASCCTPPSSAGDWPQWRGPEGTGVSAEKGVPIVWHEGRGVVWKSELPESGNSTPSIWGPAVFVTTHTADNRLMVFRVDKKSGQIIWTREVGSAAAAVDGPQRQPQKPHKFYSPASPSPVTDGNAVV